MKDVLPDGSMSGAVITTSFAEANGRNEAETSSDRSAVQSGDMAPSVNRTTAVYLCLAAFAVGYTFSLWLLDAHYGGDQKFYAAYWRAMMWAHPSQWSRLQLQYLGSAEPIYRAIIGAGTYFQFDRIEYLSCWNGLLVASIAYILQKYRASYIFAFLVFTNYYIIVLLGPAERLKFAYIFLILAFAGGGIKWKSALSAMSIFAHTQALVQFASSIIHYAFSNKQKIFSSQWKAMAFIAGVPLGIGAAGYLLISSAGDIISQKAEFYGGESQGLGEVFQWMLILFGGSIIFDKKFQFFVGMLPMGILTILFGNRVNVATLAFFCGLALTQRKTHHPLVLAVMAYMSFKTIGFIINTIDIGDGFG